MQRKRVIKAMKQHIMLSDIKRICERSERAHHDLDDAGVALDAILLVLARSSDSEDEEPSDEQIFFPEEQVAKCPQQYTASYGTG